MEICGGGGGALEIPLKMPPPPLSVASDVHVASHHVFSHLPTPHRKKGDFQNRTILDGGPFAFSVKRFFAPLLNRIVTPSPPPILLPPPPQKKEACNVTSTTGVTVVAHSVGGGVARSVPVLHP